MHRKRDDIAVLHEIAVDVAVLEILVENTPHPILQVNAIIVFQILGLRLLVRAHQPKIIRQGEGHVHTVDDPAEDGVCIHIVIRQLVQAVDVPLFIPQNGVIIVARQIAGVGNCLVVVGHGRGVIFRTHGNDRCRLRFRLRPRLCLAANSIYPVHAFLHTKRRSCRNAFDYF